jgi:proteasome lid subunit RPN8/RPN11
LSSSIERPQWWYVDLQRASAAAASQGLPNEVCGLFYALPGDTVVKLHLFPGVATASQFDANVDAVIAFTYNFLANGATVYGTFHTHPNGYPRFSKRDNQLANWGEWHVLAVPVLNDWQFQWARRARVVLSERRDSALL